MLLSSSPPVFNTLGYGPINRIVGVTETFNNLNIHFNRVSTPRRPPGAKKRVLFADDCGLKLTQVRYLTEPSDSPPRWSDDFVAKITCKAPDADSAAARADWQPGFVQPASDYMAFRAKLETQCVSLENVFVRQNGAALAGTVKVKNLCFHKEVFIRLTCNQWKSSTDVSATFASTGQDNMPNLFDTFSFEYKIPPEALKSKLIEFCVCFKTNNQEFWDNKNGENFKVHLHEKPGGRQPNSNANQKFLDIFHEEVRSPWSEFAIWNDLITDRPYCNSPCKGQGTKKNLALPKEGPSQDGGSSIEQQRLHVVQAIIIMHNNLILQHDNAPAHNATVVKNTIKDLGWEL
ncbi:PPP1R3B [Cordylochernes scorpioides]|uniref:PPP1R3B n=1 Tax=Cordylochernes scorpioides TaxID=51811 RepID=A0ABY6JWH8_9ARAC|nr:PPP1R3B [Cordylochernes scorpioides]